MTIITLKEHDFENQHSVSFEERDKKLIDVLEKENILTIRGDLFNERPKFQTHSHIGVVQFSNFAVEISPKVSIKELVGLIDYAYGDNLKIFEESKIEFAGEEKVLSEIIIATFVRQCQRLIRHGLVKSYNLREDDLPFLRGKILMSQQILNHVKTKLQFVCEYDEFEYNNLENQLILFCLRKSYYITLNNEQKKEIRRLIQYFSNWVDFHKVTYEDFGRINYNQMNNHYKNIHLLCKLIVHSTQLTDFYKQDLRYVNSFFIDMNKLFEKFVFKLFHDYYPLRPVKEQYMYDSWKSEQGKITKSIIDILICKKDGTAVHAIIDTKYTTKISVNILYQLEHYIHDHEKITEAYAILPRSEGCTDNNYRAVRQGICIKIRCIDIDEMLDLISNKKNQQIQDRLLKIIPN